ncbi:MAG TPA: magnesium chelatase domain-containing protein [Anaerolineales bacterium]|nr:magnesium chelatase domain-containing protein [Anaerolineales bacterium]
MGSPLVITQRGQRPTPSRELSLDGLVRHTRGVLPMAATARANGFKRMFVP